MHQKQNHFLVDTSSNGGTRHPICQPFEHQSQINVMVTIINHSHNKKHMGTVTKDGSIWPSTLRR
jgi:hypothetical protein